MTATANPDDYDRQTRNRLARAVSLSDQAAAAEAEAESLLARAARLRAAAAEWCPHPGLAAAADGVPVCRTCGKRAP